MNAGSACYPGIMALSDSFFGQKFGISEHDLETIFRKHFRRRDYADLYFEYLATSSISIDESIVKSASKASRWASASASFRANGPDMHTATISVRRRSARPRVWPR